MSAGIDDGDGLGVDFGVFGDGEESEEGFLVAGDNLDGGLLLFGLSQEFGGIGGDA